MDLWACQRDVTLDFSRPGKLTDNVFIEAFNSKLRSECLNARPIMLKNSTGETSPPDLSKAEDSRPERSKLG